MQKGRENLMYHTEYNGICVENGAVFPLDIGLTQRKLNQPS
jgi:hypothetical protein